MFLAPAVVELADAYKDGRITPEESRKAAEAFVRDADPDRKGGVDASALGRAMNRKIGPPPGFGPDGPPGAVRVGVDSERGRARQHLVLLQRPAVLIHKPADAFWFSGRG